MISQEQRPQMRFWASSCLRQTTPTNTLAYVYLQTQKLVSSQSAVTGWFSAVPASDNRATFLSTFWGKPLQSSNWFVAASFGALCILRYLLGRLHSLLGCTNAYFLMLSRWTGTNFTISWAAQSVSPSLCCLDGQGQTSQSPGLHSQHFLPYAVVVDRDKTVITATHPSLPNQLKLLELEAWDTNNTVTRVKKKPSPELKTDNVTMNW